MFFNIQHFLTVVALTALWGGKEMPSMAFTSSEKMYNLAIMTIEGKN